MPPFLTRIVSLALIGCLVADPVTLSAFSTRPSPTASGVASASPFKTQALTLTFAVSTYPGTALSDAFIHHVYPGLKSLLHHPVGIVGALAFLAAVTPGSGPPAHFGGRVTSLIKRVHSVGVAILRWAFIRV